MYLIWLLLCLYSGVEIDRYTKCTCNTTLIHLHRHCTTVYCLNLSYRWNVHLTPNKRLLFTLFTISILSILLNSVCAYKILTMLYCRLVLYLHNVHYLHIYLSLVQLHIISCAMFIWPFIISILNLSIKNLCVGRFEIAVFIKIKIKL